MKKIIYTNLNLYFLTGRQEGFQHAPWCHGLPYKSCSWSQDLSAARDTLRLSVADYFVRGALSAATTCPHLWPVGLEHTKEFLVDIRARQFDAPSLGPIDNSRWSYAANAGLFENYFEEITISYVSASLCRLVSAAFDETVDYQRVGDGIIVPALHDLGIRVNILVPTWEPSSSVTLQTPPVQYPYEFAASVCMRSAAALSILQKEGMEKMAYDASTDVERLGFFAVSIMRQAARELTATPGDIIAAEDLREMIADSLPFEQLLRL